MAAQGSSGIRVDGLRRLRRDLKTIPGAVEELKAANARAGQIVQTAAAVRAPRKTGRLAAAGRVSKAVARVSILWGGQAVPYAGPQHWGWPAHGIEGVAFISDAAVATEPVWVELYAADVDAALEPLRGRIY